MQIESVPKSPDRRPIAIVIGLDCITGLQMARVLHRCGIRVTGVANDPAHFATRTRCVSDITIVERNGPALLECLRTLATKDRSVLMPATDAAVAFVARHGDELSSLFHSANPGAFSIDRALGKAPFAIHADTHGIQIPRTRSVENFDDLQRAADELAGPYVLKPNLKSQR